MPPPYMTDNEMYLGNVKIPKGPTSPTGGGYPSGYPGQQPGMIGVGWNNQNTANIPRPRPNPLEQPLPYMGEMDQGVLGLNNLITQTQGSAPPGMDMNTVRMNARQGILSQGLEGPLAASVENRAVNDFTNAWMRDRDTRLAALLGQRAQLVNQLQQAEYLRRLDTYQRLMMERQARDQRSRGVWNTLGGLVGMGLGGLIGGPAGISIGGQAGTGLGDLGFNIFG